MPSAGSRVLESVRRQCLRAIAVAAAFSIFLSLLQLVVPLYAMQVYDRVLSSHSTETLIMLTVVVGGALLVFGVLDFVRGRITTILGHLLSRRLSPTAFRASVAEALANPGAGQGQAMRDINDLRLFLSGSGAMLPFEAVMTPLFLLILFVMHPLYGWIAVGGGCLLVFMSLLTDIITRKPLTAANEAGIASFGEIASAVRHAEAIEAMGMADAIAARWERGQRRLLQMLLLGNDRGQAMAAASRTIRLALQIAVIAAGAMLVMNRHVTPGSMLAAMIIMGRALAPFERLIDGWRQIVFARAAYRRLHDLLAKDLDRRQTIALPRPEGGLVVDRLVFVPRNQDRAVLKGLNFRVEPGEAVGIVGASAAGKSTLARLLVGVWEPSAGGVYLDQQSVYLWSRDNFGRYVGYLPQTVSLLDGTVRENIARMTDADPRDVIEAAKKADVHEMIGRLPFGYDTVIGDGGYSLSGGQRQRIALARALFGNPRLLVLDEPNSNLDQPGEAALLRAIASAKAAGAMVILIAHRPSVLSAVDRVVIMKEGLIERIGLRKDLLPTLGVRPQAVAPPPSRPLVSAAGAGAT